MFRCSQWNIFFCIAINLIASTPISICDASNRSKLWRLKVLCSGEPCHNCDVFTIKINQVKNMFKFVQTRFKKLLDYFEIFDDIRVSLAPIDWYYWDCSFVLHCHSIRASIFGIFAVTTVFFVLYKKIKILQCVAYQLSPLTAPFVCGQMCICVCSFIIIAAIGLLFAVFNISQSFFFFCDNWLYFTFKSNNNIAQLKESPLILNKCLWNVCMSTLHNYVQ